MRRTAVRAVRSDTSRSIEVGSPYSSARFLRATVVSALCRSSKAVAAPPTPARGEWAGRSEGELEQALEGASAALSAAQEEADRQEAAAAELERQREELDVELGARQREYEEMEARLRELQAAAMQGQL